MFIFDIIGTKPGQCYSTNVITLASLLQTGSTAAISWVSAKPVAKDGEKVEGKKKTSFHREVF